MRPFLHHSVCSRPQPLFRLARSFARLSYKTYRTSQHSQHGKHSPLALSITIHFSLSLPPLCYQTWASEILWLIAVVVTDCPRSSSSMKINGDFIKFPDGYFPTFLNHRDPGIPYFDRTGYITAIESFGSRALLFLRPRRFGKTYTLSMLQCFHGLEYKTDYAKLFEVSTRVSLLSIVIIDGWMSYRASTSTTTFRRESSPLIST